MNGGVPEEALHESAGKKGSLNQKKVGRGRETKENRATKGKNDLLEKDGPFGGAD